MTKRMEFSRRNTAALCLGIILDAMGVALITKSDFGVSAVSSVAYTLSCVSTDFSFGVWSYIYQFILFIIMCIIVKKCSIAYIISFAIAVFFGYTLDICRMCIRSFPVLMWARYLYFFIGTAVLITGVSFLMISDLPIMPQDLFTRELSSYFKIPFKVVKTAFDLACVCISLALGLFMSGKVMGIGPGTLVNAFIIGVCVDRVKGFLVNTRYFQREKE